MADIRHAGTEPGKIYDTAMSALRFEQLRQTGSKRNETVRIKKCCWNCVHLYDGCPYEYSITVDGQKVQALPDCRMGDDECSHTIRIYYTKTDYYETPLCPAADCEYFKPSARYLNYLKKHHDDVR